MFHLFDQFSMKLNHISSVLCQVNGLLFIDDLSGFDFKHQMFYSFEDLKNMHNGWQVSNPRNIKSDEHVHEILNPNKIHAYFPSNSSELLLIVPSSVCPYAFKLWD